jgi:hypothetical protein
MMQAELRYQKLKEEIRKEEGLTSGADDSYAQNQSPEVGNYSDSDIDASDSASNSEDDDGNYYNGYDSEEDIPDEDLNRLVILEQVFLEKKLKDFVAMKKEEWELGVMDESHRTAPRSVKKSAKYLPSKYLRQHASKQMVRPEEMGKLSLERMGHGSIFSTRRPGGGAIDGGVLPHWLGGRRSAAWGIYARPGLIAEVLGPRWGGGGGSGKEGHLEALLSNQAYYGDIIEKASGIEMTAMMYIVRDLDLAATREAFSKCIYSQAKLLSGSTGTNGNGKDGGLSEADENDIKAFMFLLDDDRLRYSGFVQGEEKYSKKQAVKANVEAIEKGTKSILIQGADALFLELRKRKIKVPRMPWEPEPSSEPKKSVLPGAPGDQYVERQKREREQVQKDQIKDLFEKKKRPVVEGKLSIKKGTHFVFTATPKGGLLAEAITPGQLKDRKTRVIGSSDNPLLTKAMFSLFLGPQALDPNGKRHVGNGVLFCANGGGSVVKPAPGNAKVRLGKDGKPVLEELTILKMKAKPQLFEVLDRQVRQGQRMLVNAVEQATKSRDSNRGAGGGSSSDDELVEASFQEA